MGRYRRSYQYPDSRGNRIGQVANCAGLWGMSGWLIAGIAAGGSWVGWFFYGLVFVGILVAGHFYVQGAPIK